VGTEQCDDGNSVETDGCTTQCRAGRVCTSVGIAGGAAYATDPATGVCYANFSGATTWSSAQSSCLALGGHLAVITSASEQAVVGPVVLGTPWLGATDDANDTDAVFDWVTTDGWGYTHFAAGEPDDDFGVGGGGECLAFVSEARWADTNCDLVGYTDGRVCEFAFNPCGDGLVESGEVCDDGNRIAGDGSNRERRATERRRRRARSWSSMKSTTTSRATTTPAVATSSSSFSMWALRAQT
jgi:cysteine-rich repeat protein